MSEHGTAFPSWYITFQQAALAALPRPPQIDKDTALGWADNGEGFSRVLAEVLVPPAGNREKKPESLLELIGTIELSVTTEKFVARERFVVDTSLMASVKISYLGDNFKGWFLDKVEWPIAKTTLRYQKLRKASVDGPIIAELGGKEKAETTLTEVFALISRQGSDGTGILLNNGAANVFYCIDVNAVLRAVNVDWGDVGWRVSADSVGNPGRWYDGCHVLSRNF